MNAFGDGTQAFKQLGKQFAPVRTSDLEDDSTCTVVRCKGAAGLVWSSEHGWMNQKPAKGSWCRTCRKPHRIVTKVFMRFDGHEWSAVYRDGRTIK